MGLDQYIIVKRKNAENEELFYQFRKVNCLQGYFENNFNVQNCQPFEFSKEVVLDIINLTDQVLDNPTLGRELFPIQLGFFYGNYDYNDIYLDDVKETNDVFKTLLATIEDIDYMKYDCWW